MVVDSIADAQHGLVFAEPGNVPADSYCRCEVIPVVVVEERIRVRRILARKLQVGGLARDSTGLPEIGDAGTRYAEQSGRTAYGYRVKPVLLIGHTVVVVTKPDVDREIVSELPVVFEEDAPLVLVEVFDSGLRVERQIVRRDDVEGIGKGDVGDRSCQIGQNVL